MYPLTPPLSPLARPTPSQIETSSSRCDASTLPQTSSEARNRSPRIHALSSPSTSPDFALPPSMIEEPMSAFELPEPSVDFQGIHQVVSTAYGSPQVEEAQHAWKADMTPTEQEARELYLSEKRGRPGLRIVIVTENFLPKVDGVTRTLARLLEHLEKEGHHCMLLGPGTGMSHYAGHPLVGTAGVPLVVYPGLKLNFLRPRFMRTIRDFQPDVVHFVDPVWLGAQTLMAMELGWAGEEWVSEGGPALGSGIRGAVVASYHTNLATYATLFGMPWLEPIIWRFQSWLYSKTLLTLCPSPSTSKMLQDQSFSGVRLWPRGVDLSQFGPGRRSNTMRASWGVGDALTYEINKDAVKVDGAGMHWQGRKASMPLTPPLTPWTGPVDASHPISSDRVPAPASPTLPARVVLLYVGRISWEKNLHLLLAAYANLPNILPIGTLMPKLVFVGDGPARAELEAMCVKKGWDAVFMGHRSGKELAECYASADVFVFPSFTETFGQVVLEALASGLPVTGLDAEGTRDLVQHESTGLLLPLPIQLKATASSGTTWPLICRDHKSVTFLRCAETYAGLIMRSVMDHEGRRRMGARGSTEGIKGYTWWDAMERCVDGYRESMRIARERRQVEIVTHNSTSLIDPTAWEEASTTASSSRISRVNRVVSRRLAHRGEWTTADEGYLRHRKSGSGLWRRAKNDQGETVWHLKTVVKLCMALALFYGIYHHHSANIKIRSTGYSEAEMLSA